MRTGGSASRAASAGAGEDEQGEDLVFGEVDAHRATSIPEPGHMEMTPGSRARWWVGTRAKASDDARGQGALRRKLRHSGHSTMHSLSTFLVASTGNYLLPARAPGPMPRAARGFISWAFVPLALGPEYQQIARAREQLRAERVLALTATATPEVRRDIADALEL